MKEVIKSYIFESFRERYHRSGKKGKSIILDEVCIKFSCHRKHATRLMKKGAPGRKRTPFKRGPKSKYSSPEFIRALHKVRRIMEYRNAEVMKKNMPEWLPFIEEEYGAFPVEISEKLLAISSATMKRLFQKMRDAAGSGLSTTRPGSLLRTEIPIRTDSFWDETVPGKMAADTVAHCGNTTEGQFIYSLDMVDPVTHWVAQRATWGKGHSGVLEETKSIEASLPFPLIGLHVDNGSEFINHAYIRYFTDEPLRNRFSFTRSRAYHKNDNCHVEQKNWSVVRRYFGYDRLDFQELVPMMNDLYSRELYLYLNHFCRTFKLQQKIAIKSRYRRIYGDPLTPYERVLCSSHLSEDIKERLRREHAALNPVQLKLKIEQKLRNIFATFKLLLKSRNAASAA